MLGKENQFIAPFRRGRHKNLRRKSPASCRRPSTGSEGHPTGRFCDEPIARFPERPPAILDATPSRPDLSAVASACRRSRALTRRRSRDRPTRRSGVRGLPADDRRRSGSRIDGPVAEQPMECTLAIASWAGGSRFIGRPARPTDRSPLRAPDARRVSGSGKRLRSSPFPSTPRSRRPFSLDLRRPRSGSPPTPITTRRSARTACDYRHWPRSVSVVVPTSMITATTQR
jgi:hypothetical protein